LERWRKTQPARSRIPEPLWAAVVKMAEAYGIHRTARALRLDYYSVKKRVEAKAAAAGKIPEEPAAATFLELTPAPRIGSCECTVEFEDPGGAKMRVQLKGTETPDVFRNRKSTALKILVYDGQGFWLCYVSFRQPCKTFLSAG